MHKELGLIPSTKKGGGEVKREKEGEGERRKVQKTNILL
jgi:hypothetical protein